MEAWARTNPDVRFLCVCVESKEVAMAFHRMFQFDKVVNVYIPSRPYFPVGYGQLGCSGFIVSDKDGYFVSRKTRAFLQHGEDAFDHVEALLAQLVPPKIMSATTTVQQESKEDKNFAEKKEEINFKAKIPAPPSVGIDTMDEEHEDCTQAFNMVIQNPSSAYLTQLYEILKEHFEHEEELMKKYSTTEKQNTPSFSAINSHSMDHQRMLKIACDEISRLDECNSPGQ